MCVNAFLCFHISLPWGSCEVIKIYEEIFGQDAPCICVLLYFLICHVFLIFVFHYPGEVVKKYGGNVWTGGSLPWIEES